MRGKVFPKADTHCQQNSIARTEANEKCDILMTVYLNTNTYPYMLFSGATLAAGVADSKQNPKI